MKKPYITIAVLTLISFIFNSASAQQSTIDSLKIVAQKSMPDTSKIFIYEDIGDLYEYISLDSSLVYYKKSLGLSYKTKDNEYIAYLHNHIGLVYDDIAEYDSALTNYHLSKIYYTKANDSLGLADIYSNMGGIYKSMSKYDTALYYHHKSLAIRGDINDSAGMAANYHNIATILMSRSNYDPAIEYYRKAITINKKEKNFRWLANNYTSLGSAYFYKGLYDSTSTYYKKALTLYKKIHDTRGISIIYNNLGYVYSSKGKFADAIDVYNESLILAKETDNEYLASACYSNIGIIYYYQGIYDKAIDLYKKSLEIDVRLGNRAEEGSKYNTIGSLYQLLGLLNKATEYLLKSIAIIKEIGDEGALSGPYHNLAMVYADLQEYEKAIEYYNMAVELNKNSGRKDWLANNYASLGNVYQLKKQYTRSNNYYDKALQIKKELGDRNAILGIYNSKAHLFIEMAQSENSSNNLDTAYKYLNIALEMANQIASITNIRSVKKNLAILFWMKNNMDSSETNYNNIIEIDNKNILMNFSFLSEKEKEQYITTIADDYWEFNSFALNYLKTDPTINETVFNNTVKNKGLLLKSNTAMRNAIYSSNDSILKHSYEKWIELKRLIAKKYSDGEDATSLENKADSLEIYLVKNSNEFSDLKKVQTINWKQIQDNLKKHEVAIEFTHFPLLNPDSSYTEFTNQIQYVALVVTPTSKYPAIIPLFEQKQLEAIIGKFGGNNYSYINGIYGGKNVKTSQESSLYNLIWSPIDNYLDSIGMNSSNTNTKTKVYISPSGLLHKISFPAIARKQDIYLCDVYDIEIKSTTGKIASSGSVKTIHKSSQPTTATLFGGINYDTDSTTYQGWNYLEGTQSETKKIDKILKKGKVKVNYFTNTSATEEEFKLMASNSNITHIATHGFFYPNPDDIELEKDTLEVVEDIVFRGGSRGFGVNSFVENKNPLMRSGLVFAGANDVWSKQSKNDSIEDGVLTAQEVANIDMRKTNLVVMSACETGLGDIKGSEGVYGLQRAFKMAGVDYIIMSLWQVPDKETEEFMTKFYKKLIKAKDIEGSFAETQKEMRIKYDPYFWGAFVLIE